MILNYIWVAFFVIAFLMALGKLVFLGDMEIFTTLVNSTFSSSKNAFEISLGLTGLLSLWMGIMKIGERSGMIQALSRWLSPVFCRLFPDIPKGHPAMGSIFMNLSANMLGLDNAATPLGLKAMKELQELNPRKDTATNPMIMFLVINTSGLILIPVSIMMYRAQMGAAQPTDIFIPTLLSTAISTTVGILTVSLSQRINLFCKPILILAGGISLFFAALIWVFIRVGRDEMGPYSTLAANIILFSIILLFIVWGRGCQRRIRHGRAHHPLPGGFPGGHRRVPRFGSDGLAGGRHRMGSSGVRHRHQLRRCPAYRLDEVLKRQRSQRADD